METKVITAPEGATIEVDGEKQKKPSPNTIYVSPDGDHYITATKEGFTTAGRQVEKQIRTLVVICDGVLTAGIGLLVDYLTGALYKLDTQVKLNLGKFVEPKEVKPDPKTKPTNGKPENKKPCTVCGEARGDVSPCPHCGID